MNARPEIIDDQAVAEAWLKPEEGRDENPRKARTNYASKIGHPCDRYLVLLRTHGDKAAPPSQRLRAIFKRGRVLEPVAVRQLEKSGWRVWDEQRAFDVVEKGEVILACKIDCIAKSPETGIVYVVDHKVCNPHDWEKIPRGWDGYDYLKESPKPWLRAWPAQIQSYMYVHPGVTDPVGLLHLLNAETLLPKTVYVPFDVEYMQWILDRSIRINAQAKAVMVDGMVALPPPIDWDDAVCGRCELLGTCLPDQLGRTPLELIEDDSFIDLVKEDRELSKQKGEIEKRYKLIHDRVKHMVGDRKEVAAGPFWITQKEIAVREYTVAAKTQVRMDIKELAPKEAVESEEVA